MGKIVIIGAGATSTTTIAGKFIMPDVTSGKILVGDNTSYEEVAVSGDATLASNGAVTLAAAQTNITSIINSSLAKIGTAAAQEYIDFAGTANEVNTFINNTERLSVTASGVDITGDVTVTGDTTTFTSANANDPLVVIQNTTNDASAPRLKFNKNRIIF